MYILLYWVTEILLTTVHQQKGTDVKLVNEKPRGNQAKCSTKEPTAQVQRQPRLHCKTTDSKNPTKQSSQKSGMREDAWNPALKQEDHKFKTSLNY